MVHFEFPQKSAIQNSFVIKITSADKSFLESENDFSERMG
jgi:hypothetical protein